LLQQRAIFLFYQMIVKQGPYIFRYYITTLIFLLCCSTTIVAQDPNPFNNRLNIRFLKDSVESEEGKFAFNNVTLTNITAQPIVLQYKFTIPCFVSVFGNAETTITLLPQQSQIIPIRFSGMQRNNCPNTWQPFEVQLTAPELQISYNSSFKVKPKLSLKWKASLPQQHLVVPGDAKKIEFYIKVENNGNARDKYLFDFKTNLPLNVSKTKYFIELNPGESKMAEIQLALNGSQLDQIRNEEITITLENGAGDRKLLIQKIVRVGNVFVDNFNRWHTIPLTAELNTMNIFSGNPLAFVRLFGNLDFKGNRQLSVAYQSDNYFGKYRNNTSIHSAIYKTKNWQFQIGTMQEFNNFLINGDGVKTRYMPTKEFYYEAMYIKSRLGNTDQLGVKLNTPISKVLALESNSFANLDHIENINSYFSQNKLVWDIAKGVKAWAEVGLGTEKVSKPLLDTALPGSFAGLHFEKTNGDFTANVQLSNSSKDYPGLNKGFTQYQHDIRWQIKKINVGSFVDISNHQPSLLLGDSTVAPFFNYKNTDISGRLGWSNNGFNLTFLPGIFIQQQDSANSFKANMNKLTTQFFWGLEDKWQITVFNNIGFVKIPERPEVKPFFSMYNIANIQYKNFGLFSRYDMGPYYYFEIKLFAVDQQKFSRLQLAPFHNLHLKKWNLVVRTQVNYAISKPLADNNTYLISNILWQKPDNSFAAGTNTNVDLKTGQASTFNVFVRKAFKMPYAPIKGMRNIQIVFYKDAESNNIKDKTDDVVSNVRIYVNNTLVETDKNGGLQLKNFNKSFLDMDLSTISNLRGWIPVQGFKQKIPIVSNKTIYIPFKKGKVVSGRIIVDKDDKSDINMLVEGIRITATGKDGTTFSTLTNVDGEYYINLPADQYILSINQNAIDEKFKAADPVKTIDLINNDEIKSDFLIKQKRRQINIKKG